LAERKQPLDEQLQKSEKPTGSLLQRLAETCLRLLRFFSRLPVPEFRFEAEPHALPDPKLAAVAMVLAALVIALPAAILVALAAWLGLSTLVIAGFALLALALTTGGLHEDGLADTVDGFSGAQNKERILEIMRDSRIGAHGTLAILLSYLLQFGALLAILDRHGVLSASVALMSAAISSRVLCLTPLALLPPARDDGKGAGFGQLPVVSLVIGLVIAIDLALVAVLVTNLTFWGAVLGLFAAMLFVRLMLNRADKKIGGHTGDICGACQQGAFVALLIGFSLA
jgi:adenosylcobinamide-GDP ribazoletransferase